MIITNKNIPHTPVLIEEVIQTLKVKNDLTYVDATFGFGGISERILDIILYILSLSLWLIFAIFPDLVLPNEIL